jgi:hypothetical protein
VKGKRFALLLAVALAAPAAAHAAAKPTGPPPGHVVFMPAAQENADLSAVTLPAYRGSSHGKSVWFVVTDSSSKVWADRLGANFAPKLVNAASAAMPVSFTLTGIDFPATVDFSPKSFVEKGDYGQCGAVPFLPFGKKCFAPGAVGESGYTPLILLPDGTVLNAPQVANGTGRGDKVLKLEADRDELVGSVTYGETTGLYEGHTIHYMSFDASIPPAAALEGATLAPHLIDTKSDLAAENTDPANTSRSGLFAFTNGQTGKNNPERQGLNSAILDMTTPLNVLQFIPDDPHGVANYSPLWDMHLATWDSGVTPTRQNDFETIRGLSAPVGPLTQPNGAPLGPSGFVVNCPIVSTDGDGVIVLPK